MSIKIRAILFMFFFFSINGCQFSSSSSKIRILILDDANYNKTFIDAYRILHPKIEIELKYLPYLNHKISSQTLEDHLKNSDLVISNEMTFKKLVQDKKLKPLDIRIKEDFSWEDYEPFLKKSLQNASEGKEIYGMAPKFQVKHLVCDLKKFKKAGIVIPDKQLTWHEFVLLNQQLRNSLKEPSLQIGNGLNNLVNFQKLYAKALGVKMFNPITKKIDLSNPKWRTVWQETLRLAEQEIIVSSKNIPKYAIQLEDLLTYKKKNGVKRIFFPKCKENSQEFPTMKMGPFYGISTYSLQEKEIWKIIKYVMEDHLPINSISNISSFFIKHNEKKEKNIYPIYQGPSDYIAGCSMEPSIGKDFENYNFDQVTEKLIKQVIKQEKSLDEALVAWKKEGKKLMSYYESGYKMIFN